MKSPTNGVLVGPDVEEESVKHLVKGDIYLYIFALFPINKKK